MTFLSSKTLRLLRLTHRYVSFVCAGILLIYVVSGFLLNHQKEFDFMRQKRERTVNYHFAMPQDKNAFSEADAKKIMSDLDCDSSSYKRFTLGKDELSIIGDHQLVIKLKAERGQAYVKEIHRPKFLTALNRLHKNPDTVWTIASDVFLLLMVVLIITGLLIVPGRKGILGWGGVWILVGILIPSLIYWLAIV